ncbi:MAG TPA: hypothetical protein VGM92_08775 [Candidatus Kapabacteria bacterium]
MDIEQVKLRTTLERPNRRRLIEDTSAALALFSGGREELQPLILLWSGQEDPASYEERVRITADNYRNLLRQIINKYLEAITRAGEIKRECENKDIDDYIKSDYKQFFWAECAPYLLLLGEFWVQGAYPVAKGEIQTAQDQIDMQGNPYLTIHYPQFIRNFEYDRDGNLLWVTVERPHNVIMRGAIQTIMRIEYYDDTNYVVFDKKGVAGKTGTGIDKKLKQVSEPALHGFGEVPFRRFAYSENNALLGEPKIGESRTADVIRGCKGLLHWISMQVEAAHIHLRLQLVGPKKTLDAINENGMGNRSYIPEDSGGLPTAGHPVRYLEKPRTEFDILDRIVYERKVNEIYEDARLRDPSIRKAAESGFAKMLDMIPDLGVNKENRDYLMQCDEEILELIANPDGKDKIEIVVTYPDSFDIKSVNEKIKETTDMYSTIIDGRLPRSKTADQMVSRELYLQRLQSLSEAEQKTLDTELKADADRLASLPADLAPPTTPIPLVKDVANIDSGEAI